MKTLERPLKTTKTPPTQKKRKIGDGPPTRREAEKALESLRKAMESGKVVISVEVNGEKIQMPEPMSKVLDNSLKILSHGQSVAVSPVEEEIGTQAAAKMLGVSRPHLVKLLDAGEIPSRKVGTHRRVLAVDILDFREREKLARRAVLAKLAAADQELGLIEG